MVRKPTEDFPEKDINALTLMILSVLRDTPEFRSLAHLAYILTRDDFDKLIDICGGMTLTIPTREEFERSLRAIVYYYYRKVYRYSKVQALDKSGLSLIDLNSVEGHLKQIGKVMKSFKNHDLS